MKTIKTIITSIVLLIILAIIVLQAIGDLKNKNVLGGINYYYQPINPYGQISIVVIMLAIVIIYLIKEKRDKYKK